MIYQTKVSIKKHIFEKSLKAIDISISMWSLEFAHISSSRTFLFRTLNLYYNDELMMAKKHNIVIINLIKFQNVIITHIVEVLMVLAVLLHLNC